MCTFGQHNISLYGGLAPTLVPGVHFGARGPNYGGLLPTMGPGATDLEGPLAHFVPMAQFLGLWRSFRAYGSSTGALGQTDKQTVGLFQ